MATSSPLDRTAPWYTVANAPAPISAYTSYASAEAGYTNESSAIA